MQDFSLCNFGQIVFRLPPIWESSNSANHAFGQFRFRPIHVCGCAVCCVRVLCVGFTAWVQVSGVGADDVCVRDHRFSGPPFAGPQKKKFALFFSLWGSIVEKWWCF